MPNFNGKENAHAENLTEQELIEEVRHELSDEIKHEMEETVRYSKIHFTVIVVGVIAITIAILAWYINGLQ